MSAVEGRAALFTGASGGVGAGVADVLADEGAVVDYLWSDPKASRQSGYAVRRPETRPQGRRSLKGPG